MKFIRFIFENQVQTALINEENSVFPIKFKDYVEFYYYLKENNLTASDYIQKENIQPLAVNVDELHYTLPIVPEEIWASGVTYLKSKEARNYEATKANVEIQETFYDKVYDAERPEI